MPPNWWVSCWMMCSCLERGPQSSTTMPGRTRAARSRTSHSLLCATLHLCNLQAAAGSTPHRQVLRLSGRRQRNFRPRPAAHSPAFGADAGAGVKPHTVCGGLQANFCIRIERGVQCAAVQQPFESTLGQAFSPLWCVSLLLLAVAQFVLSAVAVMAACLCSSHSCPVPRKLSLLQLFSPDAGFGFESATGSAAATPRTVTESLGGDASSALLSPQVQLPAAFDHADARVAAIGVRLALQPCLIHPYLSASCLHHLHSQSHNVAAAAGPWYALMYT